MSFLVSLNKLELHHILIHHGCHLNAVVAFLLKRKLIGSVVMEGCASVGQVFKEIILASDPSLSTPAFAHLTNYYAIINFQQNRCKDVLATTEKERSKMFGMLALLHGLHHLIMHLL